MSLDLFTSEQHRRGGENPQVAQSHVLVARLPVASVAMSELGVRMSA